MFCQNSRSINGTRLTMVSLAISLSMPAAAVVSDDEFAEMQAQLAALSRRMVSLETENAELRKDNAQTLKDVQVTRQDIVDTKKSVSKVSWAENIKLKGDFRYRFENIDEQGKDDRDRNRIRARAAIIAKLPEDVEVGLGFASGGDDPVSTNQTLGGGGSTKDLRLDLAYFNWQALENVQVLGGKYKNLNYRPGKYGLLWDGDFNPEGFGIKYSGDNLFANFSGTWLESDSKMGNDEFSWSAQVGYTGVIADTRLTAGAGYHDIETKGQQGFFGDGDAFFGNSFTCDDPTDIDSCVYRYDYQEVELFAEASMQVMDMPLALFANWVQNQDADDFDTGWAAGVTMGKTQSHGTWKLSYIYQDLEADAVLGLLTDSDFGGGGTDAEGHVFKGAWAMGKQWTLGFSYFLNEVGEDAGNKHDYDRVMLDAQFKY
jgi:hypothetical protein